MGRPTRQAAKAKDNAVETAAHRFLELLADRLREDGVLGHESNDAVGAAVKESIEGLPDSAPFKTYLTGDLDKHVDLVLRHVLARGAAAKESKTSFPFNLAADDGVEKALTRAAQMGVNARRSTYYLLLACAPNGEAVAKVARACCEFEQEHTSGQGKHMEALLRSLQLASVGSWVPASLCAYAEVHFACYTSKLDIAIEKSDQKKLAEFFERYREFISTLAFRLSTMQLPVASWSAHERQRFYSVVAAVLAQYIDIMVCGISLASVDFVSAQVGLGDVDVVSAATQMASTAMLFLKGSFEHCLDLLLSLTDMSAHKKTSASPKTMQAVLFLYETVLLQGLGLPKALADRHLFAKYICCARRAKLLADAMLRDSQRMDDVLRGCLLLDMPMSFPNLAPEVARTIKGKPHTREFQDALIRYMLFAASEQEIEGIVDALSAEGDEAGDENSEDVPAFYIDAQGLGEARAPKALVPKEGAEDEEDDAAIQAEVQAMLDSIKRKGEDTDSDDDSEGDAEADALRYSEVEKTGPKEGKDSVAALLDAGVDVHDVGEDVELPEEKEESHAKPAKARSAKKAAPAATPSSRKRGAQPAATPSTTKRTRPVR